jgi:hypothetical protein
MRSNQTGLAAEAKHRNAGASRRGYGLDASIRTVQRGGVIQEPVGR